ncbi:MAG: 30S ribosomal protein S20 [Bdellovibrionaceae bacterium]|nr:30S ribosomal protein S20 [Pseudobdellovibrionaceae bacterium]
MATHKSAEKRARQTTKRTSHNRKALSTVRSAERKLRDALAAAEPKKAQELLMEFSSKAQKAAGKGRVHARNAQRKIGRLSLAVHNLVAGKLTSNQARQASKRA